MRPTAFRAINGKEKNFRPQALCIEYTIDSPDRSAKLLQLGERVHFLFYLFKTCTIISIDSPGVKKYLSSVHNSQNFKLKTITVFGFFVNQKWYRSSQNKVSQNSPQGLVKSSSNAA